MFPRAPGVKSSRKARPVRRGLTTMRRGRVEELPPMATIGPKRPLYWGVHQQAEQS
jgi:hypothetical protein